MRTRDETCGRRSDDWDAESFEPGVGGDEEGGVGEKSGDGRPVDSAGVYLNGERDEVGEHDRGTMHGPWLGRQVSVIMSCVCLSEI